MSVTFINAAEAADLIQDRSTVAIDGFIGFCLADDILTAIEKRYIREDHPRDLSVVNVAGLGGDGQQRGINHFAHRGLMRRFLCSNLSLAPKLYPLIMDNVFPTFMMPQGVLSHMMRAIAAHRPGIISQVGMKTFVDPRIDGGKINDAAKASEEEIVQLLNLNGEEYLFYPAFPLDVAIIKGSKADTKGNISVEKEALHIETQASTSSGTGNRFRPGAAMKKSPSTISRAFPLIFIKSSAAVVFSSFMPETLLIWGLESPWASLKSSMKKGLLNKFHPVSNPA